MSKAKWPKGRQGEAHHKAKLTDLEVEKIRRLYETGIGYKRLAKLFYVHRNTIRYIVLYRRRYC